VRRLRAPLTLLALLLLAGGARADGEYAAGSLLERTVAVLRQRLPTEAERIRRLEAEYAPRAREAGSEAEEREVVFELLEGIPTSHLGLVSGYGFRTSVAELTGRDAVTLGLVLFDLDGRHFVGRIEYEGPAWRAGLRRGDEVAAIDGVPTRESPRLDFRTDDAYLPDPPAHFVRCERDRPLTLSVRTRRDQAQPEDVVVAPAPYSTLRGDRAAVRVVERAGHRIGLLSVGIMYEDEVARHLRDAFAGTLADVDALVVDVRGRGGSPVAIWAALALLREEQGKGRAVVLLVDAGTRSAKEILARRAQATGLATIVGERTAGAVRRSTFFRVGEDTWMLCPVFGLERTFSGELHGVEPDVGQADRLPWAHGADPILDAGVAEALRALDARAVPAVR